jgi:hypothetical protein
MGLQQRKIEEIPPQVVGEENAQPDDNTSDVDPMSKLTKGQRVWAYIGIVVLALGAAAFIATFAHEILLTAALVSFAFGVYCAFAIGLKDGEGLKGFGLLALCSFISVVIMQIDRHALSVEGTSLSRYQFIQMEEIRQMRDRVGSTLASYANCDTKKECLASYSEFCEKQSWNEEKCFKKGKEFFKARDALLKRGDKIHDL